MIQVINRWITTASCESHRQVLMEKHHPCLFINRCVLTHVPRKGEETLHILHSCTEKVTLQFCWQCCTKQGMLQTGWCICASKVSIGVKSCLREVSCIYAVCFSFSELYVRNDEADPEQSSSPDLPALHFVVPSQVSRRLAAYHNLCCWQFTMVHGCTLTLVQTVIASFVHMTFLSSACLCRCGCALQSPHLSDTLLSHLPHVIRCIRQFPHKLAAQL